MARYGSHADALIDLYLPPDTRRGAPLTMLIHGGFWKAQYDRKHVRPLAHALQQKGHVVALPEFRRVGGAPGLEGGYPATFDDVLNAVTALPDILARLGVQPGPTTLAGHSAGGHLVLWLASQPIAVKHVVALAPVADLRAGFLENLGEGAVRGLLGGSPSEFPERYAATDPATRLSKRPACDITVVHGQDDDRVPISQSRDLVARFPWITLHELERTEHFAVIDPLLHAWPVVSAAIGGSPPTAA